jgi:uncharacterized protein YjbI with pentapeptide repeats
MPGNGSGVMTSSATSFISDARVAVWIWSVEYIRIQTFSRVDLTQANLTGASLPDDVEDVRLADARFEYTIPNDQHISSKDIVPEATLDVGDFSDADLSGACLIAIDLSDENLSSADFFDSSVFNAILSDADLSGANLLNTNLEEWTPIAGEVFFRPY